MGLRATGTRKRIAAREVAPEGPLMLSVDTSGQWLNAALRKGDRHLAEWSSFEPMSHARGLLPALDLILSSRGSGPADVEAFGVCIGPGSFTGIRVGMTTVKTLATTFGRPVVPVTSMDLLAEGAAPFAPSALVGCLIDARRGEVYSALYRPVRSRRGGTPHPVEELLPPAASGPEEALERLLGAAGRIGRLLLAGSACETYGKVLVRQGKRSILLASPDLCRIRPAILSQACMRELAAGRAFDAAAVEPLYVGRPPIHGKPAPG